jgi:hypothetical protein
VQRQSTNGLVGLAISGGGGSSHKIGDCLVLCYTAKAKQNFRLFDVATPNAPLRAGTDDGTGECFNVVLTPPAGPDVIRIDALNAANAIVEFTSLTIMVTP